MERPENEAKHYQTFEDLQVYQVAREFRKAMYCVLPQEEKFALTSQLRRAAVSLTNNIAEGHDRFHFLEQIKFMLQSRGSFEELLDDVNGCADEGYLPNQEIESLRQDGRRVHKLINGYIRFLRRPASGDSPHLGEAPADDPLGEVDREVSFPDRFNPSSLQHFNE